MRLPINGYFFGLTKVICGLRRGSLMGWRPEFQELPDITIFDLVREQRHEASPGSDSGGYSGLLV